MDPLQVILLLVIVLVCLVLALWALSVLPIPSPLNWILKFLCILAAIVIILKNTGMVSW